MNVNNHITPCPDVGCGSRPKTPPPAEDPFAPISPWSAESLDKDVGLEMACEAYVASEDSSTSLEDSDCQLSQARCLTPEDQIFLTPIPRNYGAGAFECVSMNSLHDTCSSSPFSILTLVSFPFRIIRVNGDCEEWMKRRPASLIGNSIFEIFVNEGSARPNLANCHSLLVDPLITGTIVHVRRGAPSNSAQSQSPKKKSDADQSNSVFCKIWARPIYEQEDQPSASSRENDREGTLQYFSISLLPVDHRSDPPVYLPMPQGLIAPF